MVDTTSHFAIGIAIVLVVGTLSVGAAINETQGIPTAGYDSSPERTGATAAGIEPSRHKTQIELTDTANWWNTDNNDVPQNRSTLNRSDYQTTTRSSPAAGKDQSRVTRTIVITDQQAIETPVLDRLNATVNNQYDTLVRVEFPGDNLERLRNISWVKRILPPASTADIKPAASNTTSEGIQAINANQLHARGITGENVSVGILSCQGFNQTHHEIDDHVEATASFSSTGLSNYGDNKHGTAVAAIVADVAPDADLYLTNHDSSYINYRRAVDWLRSQNVSVIAYSCTWYYQPDTGNGTISETLDRAAQNGSVVSFVSAGNSAENHYEAGFEDPDGDGWHNIDGADETNLILNKFDQTPEQLERGDELTIELQWDEWPTSTNVDLALYDVTDESIVELTQSDEDGVDPIEKITHTIQEQGRYAVAVYSTEMQAGDSIEVTVLGDSYRLNQSTASGSIEAPAVGDRVAGVAAFNWYSGDRPAYSSAGPTDDDDIGVWIAGPTGVDAGVYTGNFHGTSASAPHAAGVAALLLEVQPSLNVSEVYSAIRRGADDVEGGTNVYTGSGNLNATGAVAVANNGQGTARFEVTDLSGPANVTRGETAAVTALITNSGSIESTQSVDFQFNGSTISSRNVTLTGGENTTVEFTLSANNVTSGTYSYGIFTADDNQTASVTVQKPANLQVSNLHAPANVTVGNNVSVSALIENTGDVKITEFVSFYFNGTLIESQNVTLSGGANTTVEFTLSTADYNSGTYGYSVETGNDTASGHFTLTAPVTFQVSNLSAPDNVTRGANLTVSAEITNIGSNQTIQKVKYRVNNTVKATNNLSLRSGETQTVTFTLSTESFEPGVYDHGVFTNNDSQSLQLSINPESPFSAPLPGTDAESSPKDPNGDGKYEDIDGDGNATFSDAVELALAVSGGDITLTEAQIDALDFDNDGDVDFDDAVQLALDISGPSSVRTVPPAGIR